MTKRASQIIVCLYFLRPNNRVPKYKHLPYIQTTDGPYYTSLALL